MYRGTGGDSFIASGWYEYYMPLPLAQALKSGLATRLVTWTAFVTRGNKLIR